MAICSITLVSNWEWTIVSVDDAIYTLLEPGERVVTMNHFVNVNVINKASNKYTPRTRLWVYSAT